MLKRKLTKAEYEKLAEALKIFYAQKGDDFELLVEGADDVGELRRAKERVDAELATTKASLADAQTKLADATTLDARKRGDIEALETSYKAKVTEAENKGKKREEELTKHVRTLLVDSKATELASDLAGENAHLLAPHIALRLSAELDAEKPFTRVLDTAGKPSALTLDELKKEFVDNKKFSAIIIASKASGGATSEPGKGRPTAVPKDKKFGELTEAERKSWFEADATGFQQAAEAARQETVARSRRI
jgi:hypothetical protein